MNDFQISDGVLEKYNGNEKNVVIPETVTKILDEAFKGCKTVEKIVMPSSVTSLGKGVFRDCSELKAITLSSNIRHISECSIMNCDSLSVVSLPEGVQTVEKMAFYGCKELQKIVLPDTLYSIGDYAFTDCKRIQSVLLPSRLETFGYSSFHNCISLKILNIPQTVHRITGYAFFGCKGLESISIEKGITDIGNYAFCGCSKLKNVHLMDGLEKIGESAFQGCKTLKYVILPESVSDVGDMAFDQSDTTIIMTGKLRKEQVKHIKYPLVFKDLTCEEISPNNRKQNVKGIALLRESGEAMAEDVYQSHKNYLAAHKKDFISEPDKSVFPVINWLIDDNLLTKKDAERLVTVSAIRRTSAILKKLQGFLEASSNTEIETRSKDAKKRSAEKSESKQVKERKPSSAPKYPELVLVTEEDLLNAINHNNCEGVQNVPKGKQALWFSIHNQWAMQICEGFVSLNPKVKGTNKEECEALIQFADKLPETDFSKAVYGDFCCCIYAPEALLDESNSYMDLRDPSFDHIYTKIIEEREKADASAVGELLFEASMHSNSEEYDVFASHHDWRFIKRTSDIAIATGHSMMTVRNKKYFVVRFLIFCSNTPLVWRGEFFISPRRYGSVVEDTIFSMFLSTSKIPEQLSNDTFITNPMLPVRNVIYGAYEEYYSGLKEKDHVLQYRSLKTILQEKSEVDPRILSKWLSRKTTYTLDSTATEMLEVLAKNDSMINAVISNWGKDLSFVNAYDIESIHMLRSLTWTATARMARENKNIEDITVKDLLCISQLTQDSHMIHYATRSYCASLCSFPDQKVVCAPDKFKYDVLGADQYTDFMFNKDKNAISKVFNMIGEKELSYYSTPKNSIFGGNNSFGGQDPRYYRFSSYISLEGLRDDLYWMQPVMTQIFDMIIHPEETQPLLPDVLKRSLLAWCQICIAAKEAFYFG